MVINSDPLSQQHAIVVICIVSPIASGLCVAIRVWTRAFVTHSVGWDDCKLPHLLRLSICITPVSYVVDLAIVTWVNFSSRTSSVVALLTRIGKLLCIVYSVLIGLGVLAATLL